MTGADRGTPLLSALRPLEVASYLRARGWRVDAELGDKGSVWVRKATGDLAETDVTLPLRSDLRDFTLRMGELVEALTVAEDRPRAEVLSDLLTSGSDLIRVRAPSRSAVDGSLALPTAVAFAKDARDLLLAAAFAAITKRSYYATKKPTKATDYLSRVRMGQTEIGSYVLTILSPVAPALVPKGELDLNLEQPEPFERQVTRTLFSGLEALKNAARQAASSGEMKAFEEAVACGVSANLCDAITGLASASPGEGIDIAISWSRSRPSIDLPTSRVFLGSDSIQFIQEAARSFRETALIEDIEIEGFVTKLSRGPAETEGEVTLEGPIDGALRRISVELSVHFYAKAVEAHRDRLRVTCKGDLKKDRGSFRLQEPRHFQILQSED